MAGLSAEKALTAMLRFYSEQRADDVEIEADGDMLLCQWGIDRLQGGESFRFNITRQFIIAENDEPYQLSLTLHFPITDELKGIESDNQWCHSPDELAEFKDTIEATPAYQRVISMTPSGADLTYFEC